VFGLFGFGDEADCGCRDVGLGADGSGEGDLEVWFGIDLGVMDCTS
jgi:hypothetical protein